MFSFYCHGHCIQLGPLRRSSENNVRSLGSFVRKQRLVASTRPCVWCVVSREDTFCPALHWWFGLVCPRRNTETLATAFLSKPSLEPPKAHAHQTAPFDLRAVSGSWQARRPNSFLERFGWGSKRPLFGGPRLSEKKHLQRCLGPLPPMPPHVRSDVPGSSKRAHWHVLTNRGA